MTTVIIDDEQATHDALCALLKFKHPDVTIIGQAYNASDAMHLLSKTQPDFIFLDIGLPDTSGFEMLKTLGKNRQFSVIFITGESKHAVSAFNYSALDFILKPFSTQKLAHAIERVRENLKIQGSNHYEKDLQMLIQLMHKHLPTDRLSVKMGNTTELISLADIAWMESLGNDKLRLILQIGNSLEISGRIGQFEERLQSFPHFIRVHRSFIVNLHCMTRLKGNELTMNDGQTIPVSYDKYLNDLKLRLKELFA